MTAVILTIHTILVAALVGVVLLQRSEGGALGMGGGGGGGGGFMSGRGAANALTRTTTVLGAAFFVTSIILALIADRGVTEEDIRRSILGEEATPAGEQAPGTVGSDDLLDLFGDEEEPQATVPATPDPVTADPVETPAEEPQSD